MIEVSDRYILKDVLSQEIVEHLSRLIAEHRSRSLVSPDSLNWLTGTTGCRSGCGSSGSNYGEKFSFKKTLKETLILKL